MDVLPLESLPLGFRFRPTDEELVNHYLKGKISGREDQVGVMPEIDVCKCEPWDLPGKSVIRSDDPEWFFFAPRDRKYPSGYRSNRATEAGYWKATGKDRTIKSRSPSGTTLIGMKKTLVFYRGRAPRGERTHWIMHEYRTVDNEMAGGAGSDPDPYVLCRLFKKPEECSLNSSHDEPGESGVSPTPSKSSPKDTINLDMESEATRSKDTPVQDIHGYQQPVRGTTEDQPNGINTRLDVKDNDEVDGSRNGNSDMSAAEEDWLKNIMDTIDPGYFPSAASPLRLSDFELHENLNQSLPLFSGEFGYPDAVPEHEDIFADMNAVYDWNFANSETKSSVMNTAADAGGPLQDQINSSVDTSGCDATLPNLKKPFQKYSDDVSRAQPDASSSSVNSDYHQSAQEPFNDSAELSNLTNSIISDDFGERGILVKPQSQKPQYLEPGQKCMQGTANRRIRLSVKPTSGVRSESSCSSNNNKLKALFEVEELSSRKTSKPEEPCRPDPIDKFSNYNHDATTQNIKMLTSSDNSVQSKGVPRSRSLVRNRPHISYTHMPKASRDVITQTEERAHVEFSQRSDPVATKWSGDVVASWINPAQLLVAAKSCAAYIFVALGAMLSILLMKFLGQPKCTQF